MILCRFVSVLCRFVSVLCRFISVLCRFVSILCNFDTRGLNIIAFFISYNHLFHNTKKRLLSNVRSMSDQNVRTFIYIFFCFLTMLCEQQQQHHRYVKRRIFLSSNMLHNYNIVFGQNKL